jgi:hypothetical protein
MAQIIMDPGGSRCFGTRLAPNAEGGIQAEQGQACERTRRRERRL